MESLAFGSASGKLTVRRSGRGFAMDFPADTPEPIDPGPECARALGLRSYREALYGKSTKKTVFIVDEVATVESLVPDFRALLELADPRVRYGIGVSAPGREGFDFESRYFNPWFGVDEDSVTGSVHTLLGPYWAARSGRNVLRARQLSGRGGEIGIACSGDRVELSGEARVVLRGTLDDTCIAEAGMPRTTGASDRNMTDRRSEPAPKGDRGHETRLQEGFQGVLYLPPEKPVRVALPSFRFFMIDGRGGPEQRGHRRRSVVL